MVVMWILVVGLGDRAPARAEPDGARLFV